MALNQDVINNFNGKNIDIKTYSPLTFAFIGDDVFDLIIRTIVVSKGNTKPEKLHNESIKYVSAVSQAKMYDAVTDMLTEEEADILRRGRNAKPHSKAKSATSTEYMKATALETLIGYLYLKDEQDRIFDILKVGIDRIDNT